VNAKNEIETKQVKNTYSNNDLVIISEGLEVGDKVIVGTINALRNGTKVSVSEVENPIKK